ncbi:MAG: dihydrofolate reductase [Candidatus Lloydbacteria bacterium]|nr:dihydrofolate reductase [Candidatus Lloydbacteria bacterium]
MLKAHTEKKGVSFFGISLFTVFDLKGVMRNEQGPPWNNSKEISEQFRRIVYGKMALMGRKTYESLAAHEITNDFFSKKTPVTLHLVLTKEKKYPIKEEHFAYKIHSLVDIQNIWLEIEKETYIGGGRVLPFKPEIVVIGGVSLYQEMLDYADTIHAILYHSEFSGDEYFPLFFNTREWKMDGVVDSREKRKDGHCLYTFVTYRRIHTVKKQLPLLPFIPPSPSPPKEPREKT